MPRRTTAVRGRLRRRTAGLSFVLPYLVFLVLFGLVPTVYGIATSFSVTPVIGPSYTSATENYSAVLSDYRTARAAGNVAQYLLIWLPTMLVVVFALALAMDARRTRFAALTRFVSYVPGAVTGAAAALLWLFMFSPGVSPVGALLRPFADDSGTVVRDGTLPLILAVMGIAAGAGGWIVLLYGALTDISKEVLEAAELDGARAWHVVWHIKLPMLRSYIGFIFIVSLANGFQVFVEPQVLGAGARGQIDSAWSLNQLVFSYATGESNYGRASALSVLLLIVTVTAAVVVVKKTRFYSKGEA
ncbi:sugar ABC transporter permease [Kitasatospora sp. NA04385]|uniref:carbohydrate ABC transporter permease n=1 Tax=Kitasatospora sp. NA04385 TaxID=2742135 RepID=UPI0015918DCB|nr:sugar ABC transporter permease [Kitasatospora sp. NA04385]QKW17741.1 sugar ABC transporter permease [Kitasatospora sp. NA04385]